MKQQRIYVRPDPELSREDDIDRIVDTLLGWFADQAEADGKPEQAARLREELAKKPRRKPGNAEGG